MVLVQFAQELIATRSGGCAQDARNRQRTVVVIVHVLDLHDSHAIRRPGANLALESRLEVARNYMQHDLARPVPVHDHCHARCGQLAFEGVLVERAVAIVAQLARQATQACSRALRRDDQIDTIAKAEAASEIEIVIRLTRDLFQRLSAQKERQNRLGCRICGKVQIARADSDLVRVAMSPGIRRPRLSPLPRQSHQRAHPGHVRQIVALVRHRGRQDAESIALFVQSESWANDPTQPGKTLMHVRAAVRQSQIGHTKDDQREEVKVREVGGRIELCEQSHSRDLLRIRHRGKSEDTLERPAVQCGPDSVVLAFNFRPGRLCR